MHGHKVPAAAPEAETEAAPTAAEAVPTATPKAEDASGLHSGIHEAKPPAHEHVHEGESTTGMKLTTFVGRGRAHNVGQDALPMACCGTPLSPMRCRLLSHCHVPAVWQRCLIWGSS